MTSNMLEKLLGKFKDKTESQQGEKEAVMRQKLQALVYDDDLVNDLLPAFLALSSNEHFGKVLDLLETKEAQVEAVSGGQWFKKETNDTQQPNRGQEEQEEDNSDSLVDSILSKKYGEK